MNHIEFGKSHITTCKLLSGEIVQYYACGQNPDDYDPEKFELIGRGIIWTVNGINQGCDIDQEADLEYFFKRK